MGEDDHLEAAYEDRFAFDDPEFDVEGAYDLGINAEDDEDA